MFSFKLWTGWKLQICLRLKTNCIYRYYYKKCAHWTVVVYWPLQRRTNPHNCIPCLSVPMLKVWIQKLWVDFSSHVRLKTDPWKKILPQVTDLWSILGAISLSLHKKLLFFPFFFYNVGHIDECFSNQCWSFLEQYQTWQTLNKAEALTCGMLPNVRQM